MSTKTPVQENNATYEELAEFNAASDVSVTPATPAESRNIFYRIIAILLALIPVAVFAFFEANVLSFKGGLALESYKLLDFFTKLFAEDGFAVVTLFKFLPITCEANNAWGLLHNGMLYLIPVSVLACVVAGIVAIFARKSAPIIARAILLVEILVYTGYAISLALPYYYSGMGVWATLDLAILGTIAVAFLLYFILSLVKSGKRAFVGLLIFVLTVASAGAILYAYCVEHVAIRTLVAGNILYKLIIVAIPFVYLLSVVISLMGIAAKKVHGMDVIRCVVMLLMGCGAIMVSFLATGLSGLLLYGIIATATALAMLIVETVAVSVRAKKEKAAQQKNESNEEKAEEEKPEEAKEEPAPEAEEAALLAVAPVADEPVAEEPTPAPVADEPVTEEPTPAQEVATEVVPVADAQESDAYGAKFDAFIATLTDEERMQFTQIFLLRSEGNLPGIPEYQIGGNNKTFFRKIFVNLGSLRARIPDGLMEKIYQFSIRQ